MTVGRWYFYDLATGLLTGRTLTGPDELLAQNTPAGCGALPVGAGEVLDVRSRRVNTASGVLEPWQPPKPQADELRDWAWDAKAERWLAVPTLAARKAELRTPLLQQLADEDARVVRPMVEMVAALAAGGTPPAEARAVLEAITARKDALRGALQAIEQADSAPLLEAAATRRQGPD